jgi:hypothetical protein
MKTHRTLGSLLASRVINEPWEKPTKEALLTMRAIGFSDDYVPSYNVLAFGWRISHIFQHIPDLSSDMFAEEHKQMMCKDFLWLCNQISGLKVLRKKYSDGCVVERYNQCLDDFNMKLSWIMPGCYEYISKKRILVNPITKSTFIVGWKEYKED